MCTAGLEPTYLEGGGFIVAMLREYGKDQRKANACNTEYSASWKSVMDNG